MAAFDGRVYAFSSFGSNMASFSIDRIVRVYSKKPELHFNRQSLHWWTVPRCKLYTGRVKRGAPALRTLFKNRSQFITRSIPAAKVEIRHHCRLFRLQSDAWPGWGGILVIAGKHQAVTWRINSEIR
ncbi:unnamed protein product [Calypogeia fissa]